MPAETLDVLRIVAEAPFHFPRERQIALALLGGARALDERDPLVGLAAVAGVAVAAVDVLHKPLDLLGLNLDLARPLRDGDGLAPLRTGEEDVVGERRLHEAAGQHRAGMLGTGDGAAAPVSAGEVAQLVDLGRHGGADSSRPRDDAALAPHSSLDDRWAQLVPRMK